MANEKEILLNKALDKVYSIGFGLEPDSYLEEYFAEKLMIIGTTHDEQFNSLSGLRKLIQHQQEQSKGIQFNYTRKEVFRDFPGDGNTAVIVEDVAAAIKVNNDSICFDMRSSAILEFENDRWKLIHWHASKPEMVQSEQDTFGIDDWKQKTNALEKLVAERTADLVQKNRELEIETSLERVRTVAMSMHKPADLLSVSKALFAELKSLGFHEIRNALINTFNDEKLFFLDYDYSDFLGGHITTIPYNTHPLIEKHLKQIRQATDAFAETIVAEKELESWIEGRRANGEPDDPQLQGIPALYYYFYSTGPAAIGLSTYTALSTEKRELLKRFRNVFELAYQRYADIQKAEANAREAQVEVALEKIRSRSLVMRHSNELKDVIAIMFQKASELNVLLGTVAIWLFNKATMDSLFWVGNNLQQPALVNLPYDEKLMLENTNYKDSWQAFVNGESYFNKEYNAEQKNRYFKYVFAHNDLIAIPSDARDFIMQGNGYRACLLVEQNSSLYFDCWQDATYSDESIQLLRKVAKTFEQTYIRFLDLQKAEAQALRAEQDVAEIKAARKKAEEALSELRSTQTQLIQAEKMASLGELTAGIAHEIQNPLNFVNNFSEVSNELLDEMKEELSKGNYEEVKAIANDVRQNLQKIAHHGKRADAIVKGMLQHSRSSSGQKEPTDINALADEYLRLAYHGLRAKDSSFNAAIKTEFDKSIGNINIVSQDVGRVILNLLTNAFYAVNDKKQKQREGYEPAVTIRTKKHAGKVEVSVSDNGNGIPSHIIDKIFLPFFTTKPAGQGTGLGLSLSYDIITKGHGGELKAETKAGLGTEFVIILPA